MAKIKKNDQVVVVCGKNKGDRGVVTKVLPTQKKVIVSGINLVHKHVKTNPNTNTAGEIIKKEAAIDISNVALWNNALKKAGKVGLKKLEDGRKVRYFKSNNELVEV